MTEDKQLFHELDERKTTVITQGDNSIITTTGIGSIKMELPKGSKTIYGILYVPKMRQKFIKLGMNYVIWLQHTF